MGKMGRINVKVKETLDRRFRQEVFRRKGLKKGNLTNALEEAMIMWINASSPVKDESKLNTDKVEE